MRRCRRAWRDRMPQRLLRWGPSQLDLVGADICSHVGVRAINSRWIIFLPGFAYCDHNFYLCFEFTGRWCIRYQRDTVVFSSPSPLFAFRIEVNSPPCILFNAPTRYSSFILPADTSDNMLLYYRLPTPSSTPSTTTGAALTPPPLPRLLWKTDYKWSI